jgi:hypothetical protein
MKWNAPFLCAKQEIYYLFITSVDNILKVPLSRAIPQLVKKFPASYGTRRFITAFTSARHMCLSWAYCLHHTKGSVQVAKPGEICRNILSFHGEASLATRPTPRLEEHPLSAVRSCLFNIFQATLSTWRPFFNQQHHNAPCCGYKDTLITVSIYLCL